MKTEDGKVSILAIMLVIAFIAIAVMGVFMYKILNDKTAESKRADELQAQMNDLDKTVSELQGKLDSVSNIINSDTSKDTTKESTSYQIQGRYVLNPEDQPDSEGREYIFEGNKVKFGSTSSAEGTFKIEGNKIIITYTKSFDPDGNEIETFSPEELIIEDENNLKHINPANGFVSRYEKQ